jgi:pentatricopeptide repeat protein
MELLSLFVRPQPMTLTSMGICRTRQVACAWNCLQMLSHRGHPCNCYRFNAVIHGFRHEGQVQKSMEVFDGMKKGGFVPHAHSYGILVDGLCKQVSIKYQQAMAWL